MSGKSLRLRRLVPDREAGCLLIALDHGLSTGPLKGLEDPVGLMEILGPGACSGYVVNRGMLVRASESPSLEGAHFLLHTSISTRLGPDPGRKYQAGGAEEALRLGADGLSVQVTFGHGEEGAMLADLSRTARDCEIWGLPLLVMAYLQGGSRQASALAHAARACAELGADLVKLPLPEEPQDLEFLCRNSTIPVLIAGGERIDDGSTLDENLAQALRAGARGAVVGRQVFQSPDPGGRARTLRQILQYPALAAGKGRKNGTPQGIMV